MINEIIHFEILLHGTEKFSNHREESSGPPVLILEDVEKCCNEENGEVRDFLS